MMLHGRHEAIIWTSAGILLIRPLRTNFNEIFFEIRRFPYNDYENVVGEMVAILSLPQCVNTTMTLPEL